MVEGEGFEPSKPKAGDLQSRGFDRSPTPPTRFYYTYLKLQVNGNFNTLYGAGTKNRTRDLLITSQLLYQLSYTGIVKVGDILAIIFGYASGYFLISHYFYHYLHQLLEFHAKILCFLLGVIHHAQHGQKTNNTLLFDF